MYDFYSTDKKTVCCNSVSYHLTGRKSNPIFRLLKYLIEHTAALIQQVMTYNPAKQIDDVIIATSNILHEIDYHISHQLSFQHRL